jgi:hypothetical protein
MLFGAPEPGAWPRNALTDLPNGRMSLERRSGQGDGAQGGVVISGMRRILLLLGAAIAGCGDFGPGTDLPRGAYVLESVNGNALPFVIEDDAELGRWVLHADTMFVRGGGRAERRRRIEVTGSRFLGDTVMQERWETTYRLVNGRLEVGYFECPINAICTAIVTGEIVPNGFRLPVGLVISAGDGVFRRAR